MRALAFQRVGRPAVRLLGRERVRLPVNPPAPPPPTGFPFAALVLVATNADGTTPMVGDGPLYVRYGFPNGTRGSDGLYLQTETASNDAFSAPLTGEGAVRRPEPHMLTAADFADNDGDGLAEVHGDTGLDSQPNSVIRHRARLVIRNMADDGYEPVSDWSNMVGKTVSALVPATLNPADKSPASVTELLNSNMTIRSKMLGFGTPFGVRATQGRVGLYAFGGIARRVEGTGNTGHCRIGILDAATPIGQESTFPKPGQDANGASILFERGELFWRDANGFNQANRGYVSGEGARVIVITGSPVAGDNVLRVWFMHNGAFVGTGTQNPATREGGYPVALSGPPMPWLAPMLSGNSRFEIDFLVTAAQMPELPAGVTPWNG